MIELTDFSPESDGMTVNVVVPKFMSGAGDYVERRDDGYWTIGRTPEKIESGVIFEIAPTDQIEMRVGGLTVVHRQESEK